MDAYIEAFKRFIEFKPPNKTMGGEIQCEEDIDIYTFLQVLVVPAVIINLTLACSRKRLRVMFNVFKGRPGLLHPMDTMTRRHRFKYAMAFGGTSLLVYGIVWKQRLAIEYSGPAALTTCMSIISIIIYGLVSFPTFACLALDTAFAYGLVAPYMMMFAGINVYTITSCQTDEGGNAAKIIRHMPVVFSDFYLAIYFPIGFVMACRKKRYFTPEEDMKGRIETVTDIRASYEGRHVVNLLKKPKYTSTQEPEGITEKIKARILRFIENWIYRREDGFQYPSRLLAVVFISQVAVYLITVELVANTLLVLEAKVDGLYEEVKATVGWDDILDEIEVVRKKRDEMKFAYRIAQKFHICAIIALSIGFVISLLSTLHLLSTYRTNIHAMYRGDYRVIPSPNERSAVSLCVGSIKYAGFQVAYIFWAYIIMAGVLFIVCLAVATIVILIQFGFGDFLVDKANDMWPGLIIATILMLLQNTLVKFFFLQGNGRWLRLDNRRLFFIFNFFLFFYNIFLGLLSCLLRIAKAVVIGAILLSRLDNSTLPRKFEFLDPGFSAYQGFIHMEAAHTHPVVLVFLRLLQSLSKQRHLFRNEADVDIITDGMMYESLRRRRYERKRSMATRNVSARFNWHVAYTLLHNPQVRIYRKGFIQSMQKARKQGIRIPISDMPVTDFDMVKALDEREREWQEAAKKTSSQSPSAVSPLAPVQGKQSSLRASFSKLKNSLFGKEGKVKEEHSLCEKDSNRSHKSGFDTTCLMNVHDLNSASAHDRIEEKRDVSGKEDTTLVCRSETNDFNTTCLMNVQDFNSPSEALAGRNDLDSAVSDIFGGSDEEK